MSKNQNKKGKGFKKLPLIADALHARLKMIAIGKSMTFDDFISESLWQLAKDTPVQIPQAPK